MILSIAYLSSSPWNVSSRTRVDELVVAARGELDQPNVRPCIKSSIISKVGLFPIWRMLPRPGIPSASVSRSVEVGKWMEVTSSKDGGKLKNFSFSNQLSGLRAAYFLHLRFSAIYSHSDWVAGALLAGGVISMCKLNFSSCRG